MIKDRDIVVFSDDWGRYPSTLQHLIKYFLPYNRVFWIGSLGLRKPKLNWKDLTRAFQKFKKILSTGRKSENSAVSQLNPFVIPLHDSAVIRKFNKISILRKLNSEFGKLGVKNPLLLTSSPIVSSLIGELGETSAHYFCVDDYTKFEGAFESIGFLEQRLLEKVDSTFATADKLLKTRIPKSGRAFSLPQGVDLKHFKNVDDQIPVELKDIKKPVIGFFGLITYWINLDLLIRAAEYYPQFSFLIIGPSEVDLSELTKLENVIYTGQIPYDTLPNHAKMIDVGLIPFKINELTVSVNPLKLLEYMSFGIPIVTTDLPEAQRYGDLVYIAEDEIDFISKIKTAAEENDAGKKEIRTRTANDHSWQNIAENISGIISDIESKK